MPSENSAIQLCKVCPAEALKVSDSSSRHQGSGEDQGNAKVFSRRHWGAVSLGEAGAEGRVTRLSRAAWEEPQL